MEFVPGSEYEGVVWDRFDFTHHDLTEAQFAGCRFVVCDFSSVVLASTRFEDCEFTDGNLSNTVVDHTRFDGVRFVGCKLVGLNFGASDPLVLSLAFERCVLRYVNFSQLRWKNAVVTDCDALESDFRGTRAPGADFTRTRFRGCRFSGADLAGSDFRHAEGYDLDLRTEKLKKAQFSLPEALNLLAPFDLRLG